MMTHSRLSTVAWLTNTQEIHVYDGSNQWAPVNDHKNKDTQGGRKISRVVSKWTRLKHGPIKVDHTHVFSLIEQHNLKGNYSPFRKCQVISETRYVPVPSLLNICPSHFNGTLIRPQPLALARSKALREPPVFFSTWSTSPGLASLVFPLLPSAQRPTGIHAVRPVPSDFGFLVRQDDRGQESGRKLRTEWGGGRMQQGGAWRPAGEAVLSHYLWHLGLSPCHQGHFHIVSLNSQSVLRMTLEILLKC